jgi:hypothetical protein
LNTRLWWPHRKAGSYRIDLAVKPSEHLHGSLESSQVPNPSLMTGHRFHVNGTILLTALFESANTKRKLGLTAAERGLGRFALFR